MSSGPVGVSSLRLPIALDSTQGTLALDITPRLEPPTANADETAVPPPGGDVVGIEIVARKQLEGWARRYAQAVVEIVNGDRPASQLVRWTAPRVHEELTRRAQIVARAGVHQAGQGRGRRPVVRPAVRGVRSCFVAPSVAEVSVHVRYGERSRAVAARFERRDQKWICTALEFA